MQTLGCLYCQNQQNSYSWSGADIEVTKEIFHGSFLRIAEILENPWQQERYPKEHVLQCENCNAVWHIEYHFPGRPPLMVNARVIPREQLKEFFKGIGDRLFATHFNPPGSAVY
ncbi:MAG: hypothetical protein ABH826_05445 [Patescibacteria group bacterium]|nr:hypothetical protein [Patescibacteria group bacterium]